MPRILIADDDAQARAAVRSLLKKQRDWNISEAENDRSAIEKVREERPEVVLLDLLMPPGNPINAAYEIRQIAPATKILFLTDRCDPDQASALARLFGSGEYVPKAEMTTHLAATVSRLLKGPAETSQEGFVLPGAPPTERKMRSSTSQSRIRTTRRRNRRQQNRPASQAVDG